MCGQSILLQMFELNLLESNKYGLGGMNLKVEREEKREAKYVVFRFVQVVENEYVTTVCLPWWDEEEDYMRFLNQPFLHKVHFICM